MRRDAKKIAISFAQVLLATAATTIFLILGGRVSVVIGILVFLFSLWNFRESLRPKIDKEEVVMDTLNSLGGRATESDLEAALFATVNDGSIYEDERMEDLRDALSRLCANGRIAADGQSLYIVGEDEARAMGRSG